jgi:hypothetical protein
MTTPCGPSLLDTMWLGRPGAMTRLRIPDAGWVAPLGRAEVAHTLAGGGTTVTRRAATHRAYSVNLSKMTPDEAQLILAYYLGNKGSGPWALVDPSYRNQLSPGASSMGVAAGRNTAWNPLIGDAAAVLDSTVVPPVDGTGVLRWAAPTNGKNLFEGTQPTAGTFVPVTTKAVPYLSPYIAWVSVYLRAQTTATVKLYALGCNAAGWDGVSVANTANVALTTAWQRVTLSVPAASWAGANPAYIVPNIQVAAVGASDVLVAAAQIDYGYSSVPPWVAGLGVPRVVLSAGVGAGVSVYWRRDHGLTMAEV